MPLILTSLIIFSYKLYSSSKSDSLKLNLSQFIYTIRKRIKLEASEALFFFIDNTVPKNSAPIGELYNLHKDKDGFLYITYNSENTFG